MRELLAHIEGLRAGERPPLLAAHAHRFRAKLSGDEVEYRAATALFRELELSFWLAVTLLEHAETLVDEGRRDEAEPLLAEACEIFERLEAVPRLQRAQSAATPERVTA